MIPIDIQVKVQGHVSLPYLLQLSQVATKSKSLKSNILILPHPKGYVMSVKCEKPLEELLV